MKNINTCTLSGRIVRDCEMTVMQSGDQVLFFSLAVNKQKKDGDQWKDEAMFFDVKYFGKNVSGLKPYLSKGSLICITGELNWSQWEKDGQKRSKIDIIAKQIQLCGGKNEEFEPNINIQLEEENEQITF